MSWNNFPLISERCPCSFCIIFDERYNYVANRIHGLHRCNENKGPRVEFYAIIYCPNLSINVNVAKDLIVLTPNFV